MKTNITDIVKKFQKPIILLMLILILTILQPAVFPTAKNFMSILFAIAIYGIIVCGAIYPILLGGIDLSVGSVAAMSGAITVLTVIKFDYSIPGVILGILLGVVAGAVVGVIHGLIVSSFRVPAFLITLATLNIVYGIAQLLTKNEVITCMKPDIFTNIGGGRLLGVPVPVYILVIMVIISYFFLNHTVFGRNVYAVGGNPTASELSGISSKKIQILSYVYSSLSASIAGIVLASMNQQAIAKAAQGYENDVLTAIVVGGTSLMGGEGSIQGAMFGALLVGILNNGLRLMGVPSMYHTLIKGIIIVIAVSFDVYSRNRGNGLSRKLKFKAKKVA